MTWADFWKGLEQQAKPCVEAELAKLGWKLTATSPWTAIADHGRPVAYESAMACSPDELIEKVRAAGKSKTCCEGECPECFAGEGAP
jgi:hypothetical protein